MNIVICCDGTNNSFQSDLTNVARMSLIAVNDGNFQTVYYDAGVGTSETPYKDRILGSLYRAGGLAFGIGLVRNVAEAYLQIVKQYNPGDKIFLFGFSRGAYTVRVLAGLLHNYGLLRRGNESLADMIVSHYRTLFPKDGISKQEAEAYTKRTFAEAAAVKTTQSVSCPIHFMGLWDTVSSVGWIYDQETFPNTANMPEVETLRHAMALDERRAKFRSNRVTPVTHPDGSQQDLKQIWFPGVHCDVGGGYTEKESGLAKSALKWMLHEAQTAGLITNLAAEQKHLDAPDTAPNNLAQQHESLTWSWWPLELIPLTHRVQQPDKSWKTESVIYMGKGWRKIQPADLVSSSVRERIASNMHPQNANWLTFQSQALRDDRDGSATFAKV